MERHHLEYSKTLMENEVGPYMVTCMCLIVVVICCRLTSPPALHHRTWIFSKTFRSVSSRRCSICLKFASSPLISPSISSKKCQKFGSTWVYWSRPFEKIWRRSRLSGREQCSKRLWRVRRWCQRRKTGSASSPTIQPGRKSSCEFDMWNNHRFSCVDALAVD